jgi:glutaminyl-peptide cyclotransferase
MGQAESHQPSSTTAMKIASAEVVAQSVLPQGQAPDVNRARVYSQTNAPVQTYQIVDTYSHDTNDYTEGLFIHDGYLYEATGEFGKSRLKKSILATGEVICESRLDVRYFGEGATAFEDKVYRLTYLSTIGFIYRDDNLQLKGTFRYPSQGWGLTTDGKRLIMSNGSAAILFLNPRSCKVEHYIVVEDNYSEVGFLNELEYVDGEIYANVWKTNYLVRFSAKTGKVTGWVDLKGLNPDPKRLVKSHVLNGIAHNREKGTLLVTGKNWPSLWHIKLVPTT